MKKLPPRDLTYWHLGALAVVCTVFGGWAQIMVFEGWSAFWDYAERFQTLLAGILAVSAGLAVLGAQRMRLTSEASKEREQARSEIKALAGVLLCEWEENNRRFLYWAKLIMQSLERSEREDHERAGCPPALVWKEYEASRNRVGILGPDSAVLLHMTVASYLEYESSFGGAGNRMILDKYWPMPTRDQFAQVIKVLRECSETGEILSTKWFYNPSDPSWSPGRKATS